MTAGDEGLWDDLEHLCSSVPLDEVDLIITALDDVASKLASEHVESAAALRTAALTLQTGTQAEIRRLCSPWGVRLTEIKASGK